ncbi:unnamed protein product [Amoebophrya sp. A120]|nr:unnamed protein product [Amoebophrya sp. A120]|eukprot:GSA120T00003958001.1
MYAFSIQDVIDHNDEVPWGGVPETLLSEKLNGQLESEWEWLFRYLEDLEPTLEAAGFQLGSIQKGKPDTEHEVLGPRNQQFVEKHGDGKLVSKQVVRWD